MTPEQALPAIEPASLQDVMWLVFEYAELMDGFGSLEGPERTKRRNKALKKANKIRAAITRLAASSAPQAVPEGMVLDAAGQPKLPMTLLESYAVDTANRAKAWLDGDEVGPCPLVVREGFEVILMMAAARRKGVQ